eukprot:TRINITY_DN579_c0_g3_i9.p1 TRINITY_DN579_c0_g3~~TRINITY_DN579_c0_g3_i9.p1  ORF type:complete len:506 (+),score=70.06 TRINITY_DN579_c0_g3_i9:65-1582(+)
MKVGYSLVKTYLFSELGYEDVNLVSWNCLEHAVDHVHKDGLDEALKVAFETEDEQKEYYSIGGIGVIGKSALATLMTETFNQFTDSSQLPNDSGGHLGHRFHAWYFKRTGQRIKVPVVKGTRFHIWINNAFKMWNDREYYIQFLTDLPTRTAHQDFLLKYWASDIIAAEVAFVQLWKEKFYHSYLELLASKQVYPGKLVCQMEETCQNIANGNKGYRFNDVVNNAFNPFKDIDVKIVVSNPHLKEHFKKVTLDRLKEKSKQIFKIIGDTIRAKMPQFFDGGMLDPTNDDPDNFLIQRICTAISTSTRFLEAYFGSIGRTYRKSHSTMSIFTAACRVMITEMDDRLYNLFYIPNICHWLVKSNNKRIDQYGTWKQMTEQYLIDVADYEEYKAQLEQKKISHIHDLFNAAPLIKTTTDFNKAVSIWRKSSKSFIKENLQNQLRMHKVVEGTIRITSKEAKSIDELNTYLIKQLRESLKNKVHMSNVCKKAEEMRQKSVCIFFCRIFI